MRRELERRFGSLPIGRGLDTGETLDLLTGTYGVCVVSGIYGIPIVYSLDNWPAGAHQFLSDEEIDRLEPPDPDSNEFFRSLIEQVKWIASEEGRVEGYLNWQGILNNAYRIRGESIFTDLHNSPERAKRLFDCVTQTMIDGAQRLYEFQRKCGVIVEHFTISNCLVNMISPEQYSEFILPCDKRLAESFGLIGVHNCAWTVDPYVEAYSSIPNVGYIDMGIESDLKRVKEVFPDARRAVMYKPTNLLNTADDVVLKVVRMCEEIGSQYQR